MVVQHPAHESGAGIAAPRYYLVFGSIDLCSPRIYPCNFQGWSPRHKDGSTAAAGKKRVMRSRGGGGGGREIGLCFHRKTRVGKGGETANENQPPPQFCEIPAGSIPVVKCPGTGSAGLCQVFNRCEGSPGSASGCSSCFKCCFNPSFHLPHSLFDRGDMSAGKGRSGFSPHPIPKSNPRSLTAYQPKGCFCQQSY